MKHLKFDIMKPIVGGNERFVATMRYEYNPLFRIDFDALYNWITEKRPSLKGKPFTVYTDDKVVPRIFFNQDINKVIKRYE